MDDIRILFLQDGDRRWTEREHLTYAEGYLAMARKIAFVTEVLKKRGITKLYLPVSSIANLSRPKEQLQAGFNAYLHIPDFSKIRLKISLAGDFDKLPNEFKPLYKNLETSTRSNHDFELVLLLNWSVVDETVRIANQLQANGKEITKEALLLYSDIPEAVDFIIRTGKRRRLSSFVPLSGQYAELYFMDILFPDITENDITDALEYYKEVSSTRTFGK
jgi:undecaprenyl diphosphate synthase